jgi:hypothetical protein
MNDQDAIVPFLFVACVLIIVGFVVCCALGIGGLP